jgi:hypothetical protein
MHALMDVKFKFAAMPEEAFVVTRRDRHPSLSAG